MRSFESIESLLAFNFQAMRALGHRASDEALIHFHHIFETFFEQFNDAPPNVIELQMYVNLLTQLVRHINLFEYSYYINKYHSECPDMPPETIENMARGCQLKNYQNIPIRLQYWAANAEFGDTIRFASEHRKTIKNLAKWEQNINKHHITPQI